MNISSLTRPCTNWHSECGGEDDNIVEALLHWVDQDRRDGFRTKSMEQRSDPDWLPKLIQTFVQNGIAHKMNNAINFKNFVCMTECLDRFVYLRQQ